MGCLICERIEQIQKGCNPYFVCELETGYVVLGDHQRFAGYTLFFCKQHEVQLHLLPWDYRMKFLQEMSLVAEAVYQVYQPEKMNYEEMETSIWLHLFPRVTGDTPQKGPVWWLPREDGERSADRPTPHQLEEQTKRLKMQIQKVYQSRLGFGMKL